MSFFNSFGLKRLIASYLSVIVEVLRSIPGTADVIHVLEVVAGMFGIVGITHAGTSGNITRKKLSTAAAALAFLIVLARFIPAMGPFVPFLEKAAALIGAASLGVLASK